MEALAANEKFTSLNARRFLLRCACPSPRRGIWVNILLDDIEAHKHTSVGTYRAGRQHLLVYRGLKQREKASSLLHQRMSAKGGRWKDTCKSSPLPFKI